MNNDGIRTNWADFVGDLYDPITGIFRAADEHMPSYSNLNPTCLAAYLTAEYLYGHVCSGGILQLLYCSSTNPHFEHLDKIIAKHGKFNDAAKLATRILEPLRAMDDALWKKHLVEEDWPDEFLENTRETYEQIESEIFATQQSTLARINLDMLCHPENYFHMVQPEQWQPDFSGELDLSCDTSDGLSKRKLTFRNGFPYGPNTITYPAQKISVTTLVSPDRSEVWLSQIDENDSSGFTSIMNFRRGRVTRNKYLAGGHLGELYNTVSDRGNISEQAEYFDSGLPKSYAFYGDTPLIDRVPQQKVEYYSTGIKRSEAIRHDDHFLHHVYWPDGSLNLIYKEINSSLENRTYLEAYDRSGKAMLSADATGVVESAVMSNEGEVVRLSQVEVSQGWMTTDIKYVKWPNDAD